MQDDRSVSQDPPSHTTPAESSTQSTDNTLPLTPQRRSSRARVASPKAQLANETLLMGNNESKLDLKALKSACEMYEKDDQSLLAWLKQHGFPERLVKSSIYNMKAEEFLTFMKMSGISQKLGTLVRNELQEKRSDANTGQIFQRLLKRNIDLVNDIKQFRTECPIFSFLLDLITSKASQKATNGPSPLADPEYFLLLNTVQNIVSQTHVELQRFIGLWGLCNGWNRDTFTLLNNLHITVSMSTALRDLKDYGCESTWQKYLFEKLFGDPKVDGFYMAVIDNLDLYFSCASQRFGKKNSGNLHATLLCFIKIRKSIPNAAQLAQLFPGRSERQKRGFCVEQWKHIMPSFADHRRVDVELAGVIVEQILLSHRSMSRLGDHIVQEHPKPPTIRNEFIPGCILPQNQSRPSEMIQILKHIALLDESAPEGLTLEKILHADQGGVAVARTAIAANDKEGIREGHNRADDLSSWTTCAADGHLSLNLISMIFEMGYTLDAGLGQAVTATQRRNVTKLWTMAPPPIIFANPTPATSSSAPTPASQSEPRITRSQTKSQRIEEVVEKDNDFIWSYSKEIEDEEDSFDILFQNDLGTRSHDGEFDPTATEAAQEQTFSSAPLLNNDAELEKRKGKFPNENSQVNLDFLRDYTAGAILSAWQGYLVQNNLQEDVKSFTIVEMRAHVSDLLKKFLCDDPSEWESNPQTAAMKQLIRFCLVLLVLEDCIHRGADPDIVIIWRRLLGAFKAMNKMHYFEESFRLQCAIAFAASDTRAWMLQNCRSVGCENSPWCRSADFAQENTVKVAKKLLSPGSLSAASKRIYILSHSLQPYCFQHLLDRPINKKCVPDGESFFLSILI